MNSVLKTLLSGSVACLPEGELQKKIESGKKLVIKLGMDPTAPDLFFLYSKGLCHRTRLWLQIPYSLY